MTTEPALRIQLKRAYEPAAASDGRRILVERLWPRGVTKADAAIDHWVKDLAPSPALRKWYAHDPALWDEFRERYQEELRAQPEAVAELLVQCHTGPVTFVFAARDEQRNSAVVLKAHLEAIS